DAYRRRTSASCLRGGGMDNPRPEKVAVVQEVRERLGAADAAILTEYRGLKVSELATLRRALREAGGEYRIYKNTLARLAVRDLAYGLKALIDQRGGAPEPAPVAEAPPPETAPLETAPPEAEAVSKVEAEPAAGTPEAPAAETPEAPAAEIPEAPAAETPEAPAEAPTDAGEAEAEGTGSAPEASEPAQPEP